jgi:hypothetical protein
MGQQQASARRSDSRQPEEYERKQWKYEGYPGFAKWMASSDDFFLIRRFGWLNTRVLLMMQDEIVQKEDRLRSIDEQRRAGPDNLGISSSLRENFQSEIKEILEELKPLLKEYSKLLNLYMALSITYL